MIKKAASHRFPARVYVCVCLPVRFHFASSSHSTVSYLSGFLFFFLSALPFWGWGVGVSLHECVLYLSQLLALSLCLFKKEGKRGGNG